MKKYLTILTIFILSLIFTVYLIQNLSPFNKELIEDYISEYTITTNTDFESFVSDAVQKGIIFDYINPINLTIISLFGTVNFATFFGLFHLLIDKLFFKKPYEEPSIKIAFTRAMYLPVVFFTFVIFRILGVNFLIIVFIVFELVVFFLIEKGFRIDLKEDSSIT